MIKKFSLIIMLLNTVIIYTGCSYIFKSPFDKAPDIYIDYNLLRPVSGMISVDSQYLNNEIIPLSDSGIKENAELYIAGQKKLIGYYRLALLIEEDIIKKIRVFHYVIYGGWNNKIMEVIPNAIIIDSSKYDCEIFPTLVVKGTHIAYYFQKKSSYTGKYEEKELIDTWDFSSLVQSESAKTDFSSIAQITDNIIELKNDSSGTVPRGDLWNKISLLISPTEINTEKYTFEAQVLPDDIDQRIVIIVKEKPINGLVTRYLVLYNTDSNKIIAHQKIENSVKDRLTLSGQGLEIAKNPSKDKGEAGKSGFIAFNEDTFADFNDRMESLVGELPMFSCSTEAPGFMNTYEPDTALLHKIKSVKAFKKYTHHKFSILSYSFSNKIMHIVIIDNVNSSNWELWNIKYINKAFKTDSANPVINSSTYNAIYSKQTTGRVRQRLYLRSLMFLPTMFENPNKGSFEFPIPCWKIDNYSPYISIGYLQKIAPDRLNSIYKESFTSFLTELTGTEFMQCDKIMHSVCDTNVAFSDKKEINKMVIQICNEELIFSEYGAEDINYYNPSAIRKLFEKYYISPDFKLLNWTASDLYRISFKEYNTRIVKDLGVIYNNKEVIYSYVSEINDATAEGLPFDGLQIKKKASAEIFDKSDMISEDIVGFIIRRSVDETLPVIFEIYKKVLSEYDAELYKKIKDFSIESKP
ncbi:MAG: hypothetical protein JXR90_11535 [Spirochaetes bacterium]|nr:hypothetical protein [Spirochaetota bacterium]